MQLTTVRYSQSGIVAHYYNGPVSVRSMLLAAGFIVYLDQYGDVLQNPATREIVTLS